MWYQLLIFLPLIAALLDAAGVLAAPYGRAVVLGVLAVGVGAALKRPAFRFTPQFLRSAVISCAAALVTFGLSTKLGLGGVVASALVGILGAQVLQGRDQLVMYMGSFVGMSSSLRFPAWGPLAVAGLLAGILFELSDELWVGVGGRLGTIAAAAVVVVLAVMGGL